MKVKEKSAEQQEMIQTRCFTIDNVPDEHMHIYPCTRRVQPQ